MNFLYQMNELREAISTPLRQWAENNELFFHWAGDENDRTIKILAASNEIVKRIALRSLRPSFGIEKAIRASGNEKIEVAIEEITEIEKPFCKLKRFKKNDALTVEQPKMLIVAPLSGHFATLLRDTVATCLEDFDVYLTEWVDSRLVPLTDGDFSLDDYIDYVLEFIRHVGAGTRVLAVCQPAVPVVIAASLLEESADPAAPASLILMGGPLDTRINPGAVNDFAKSRSIDWFKSEVIHTVPPYYAGAGREVCPGFLMLSGFMLLNLDKHQTSVLDLFEDMVEGNREKVEKHEKFYNEYRAVMDIPATYFLDCIRRVFQDHDLPRGKMKWRGRLIDLKKIKRAKLMTVEGEHDDISCPGQTKVAHELCSGIPEKNKTHYLQSGAGHYGIFSGSKWRQSIYPRIVAFCGA